MDVRTESKTGPHISSLPATLEAVAAQLQAQHPAWLQQLTTHPERFANLEIQIHQIFQHGADQVVAALLAQASQQSPTLDDAKKK
jgi:pantothenate kinase type III